MSGPAPGPTGYAPMALDRPDDVRRVREALDRAGYDDAHVLDRMGAEESADLSFGPLDRPRVLRRTRDGDPLATLIRLFLGGVPVPLDDFRRAVAPMDPAAWAELGLVEPDGDAVRRRVVLQPNQGLVVVHDAALADGGLRRDHVLGVTAATILLSRVMLRIPAGRTLDLGTGGGYLAIRAAEHSRQVLATDLNPLAVAMARFNLQLNRIDNVEAVEGDLFEPAGDLRFDLIASNPPFVVSPEDELIYRDSGGEGDAICERIIREAPAHLAEGGFAQVLCNWVRIAGRDWLERLAEWIDGTGCDAWVIHNRSVDPADYAHFWLGRADRPVEDQYAARYDRWMAYYDRRGIEAIDYGLITLRRRGAGRNWMRVDADRGLNYPDGAAILASFAARDLVGQLEDVGAWLSLRLRCRPELRLSQRLRPAESGWTVDGAECVLGDGLRFEGEVDPLAFHLLTLCRGREPLADVLAQVAARLGQDPEAVRRAGLRAARSFVAQGFLWPIDLPMAPDGPEHSGMRGGDEHAGR